MQQFKDAAIYDVLRTFSRIYVGGIAPTITDGSAYLSFISVLSGIEALARYRYPDNESNGGRFIDFVKDYFPPPYPVQAAILWKFRNGIVHAFNPGQFALVHHQSYLHLQYSASQDRVYLNAEDFYAAFVFAFRKYCTELEASIELQDRLLKAVAREGGVAAIGPAT